MYSLYGKPILKWRISSSIGVWYETERSFRDRLTFQSYWQNWVFYKPVQESVCVNGVLHSLGNCAFLNEFRDLSQHKAVNLEERTQAWTLSCRALLWGKESEPLWGSSFWHWSGASWAFEEGCPAEGHPRRSPAPAGNACRGA